MACNIHMAHAKHCPFCAHGWQGQMAVMAAIVIPQVWIAQTPRTWLVRLAAGIAMFPLVEGLAALVFGAFDGYWSR